MYNIAVVVAGSLAGKQQPAYAAFWSHHSTASRSSLYLLLLLLGCQQLQLNKWHCNMSAHRSTASDAASAV
jgi:uncharacterized membrane protein YbjE (DUF340 family)